MVIQDPRRERVLIALKQAKERMLADAPTLRPQPAEQLKMRMAAMAESIKRLEGLLKGPDLEPAWDAIAALAREMHSGEECWSALAEAADLMGLPAKHQDAQTRAREA